MPPKLEILPISLIFPQFGLLLVELLKIINLDKTLSLEFQFHNDSLLGIVFGEIAKGRFQQNFQFLWFSQFPSCHTQLLTEFQFCSEVLSGFPSFPVLIPSFVVVSSFLPSFPVFKPSYLAVFPVSPAF